MAAGSPAPFAPTDLSGLAIWYDASDAASYTLDGSNNCSQWNDKSGNARHAKQTDANKRPAYLANGINGLPAFVGDGVDDIMTWAQFSSGLIHNFYFVAAFDTVKNAYTQYGGCFGSIGYASYGSMDMFCPDTSSNPRVDLRRTGTGDTTYISANNSANIKSGIAAVHSYKRNGSAYSAKWTHGTKVSFTDTSGATAVSLNDRIFANYFASMSFRISELVCYTRDLTTSEESQLSNYFSGRYGVGL